LEYAKPLLSNSPRLETGDWDWSIRGWEGGANYIEGGVWSICGAGLDQSKCKYKGTMLIAELFVKAATELLGTQVEGRGGSGSDRWGRGSEWRCP